MALEIVKDQTFVEPEVVPVDGRLFDNCRFDGCTFAYSGGEYKFVNCEVDNCSIVLAGAAYRTVELLFKLRAYDIRTLVNLKPDGSSTH